MVSTSINSRLIWPLLTEVIMNRRDFGKLALTGGAAIAAAPSAILLDGCSTSWITTLENDLPELVNIAGSIVSIVAMASGNGALPADLAPAITAAAQALQVSLGALQDAVSAYNGGKGSGTLAAVTAALTAVQADAQKVIASLPSGTVSTSTETAIVAGIGTLVTILSSVQLLIPGGAAPNQVAKAQATAMMEKPSLPDAATIRTGYNSVLILNGFESAAIR